MAVEQDEARAEDIANRRQARIQLPPEFERRWRHVERDGVAAQLREDARRPADTGAEIEDGQSGRQAQAGEQLPERTEEPGCLVRIVKRFREIALGERLGVAVIVLCGRDQILDAEVVVRLRTSTTAPDSCAALPTVFFSRD